jgi:WD40 repeat protein
VRDYVVPLEHETNGIAAVFFSEGDPFALSVNQNGQGEIWNVRTGATKLKTMGGILLSSPPQLQDFFVRETVLAETKANYVINFYDLRTGSKFKTLKIPRFERAALGMPNEIWTLSGSMLRKWNFMSGMKTAEFQLSEATPWVCSLTASTDGRQIAISHEKGFRIFDAATADAIRMIRTDYSSDCLSEAESPNLRYVFKVRINIVDHSPFQNARIEGQIWDTSSGKLVGTIQPRNRNPFVYWVTWPDWNPPRIWASAFSSDGKMLLTCNSDGVARIYDVKSHALFREFITGRIALISGAFSPDSSKVLVGNANGNVFLWDISSGTLITHRFLAEKIPRYLVK